MSLNPELLQEMKLGETLALPGLMLNIDPDAPLNMVLTERRNDGTDYRFKLVYLDIQLGTARVQVKGDKITMEVS